MNIEPIAHIHTDFPQKFGIPRQSGLLEGTYGRIIFEKKFRDINAIKGLSDFNYIWLLWKFDVPENREFTATVRPPRLNGEHMGVFATRSPFRPNPIALSSVKLVDIINDEKDGPVLIVESPDMRDNTAIIDIKPYIPYADCHMDAKDGFTKKTILHELKVDFPDELLAKIEETKRKAVLELLSQDPRTPGRRNEEHSYGLAFAGKNIRFYVDDEVLHVTEVTELI